MSSRHGTYGRPRRGGPWRRLFLDATVVEDFDGVERVFHCVDKHPANPVLRAEPPWELPSGPYLYGTVLRNGDLLRTWYHCIGDRGYRNCYATSIDGLSWERPDVGLVEYAGSRSNNIVTDRNQCHNASVMPWPFVDDGLGRWVLYGFAREAGVVSWARSVDGLRWQWQETPDSGLFRSSDVVNFFYDHYSGRVAATYKITDARDRRHRAVGVAWSDDGVQFVKPYSGAVFGADDLDPDATQIYGMPVFPYQGLYIGLPWVYHARYTKFGERSADRMLEAQADSPRTVDVQLAWSWDLVNWTRTPRRDPFIALGPDGAFDSRMIYTARAPVEMGDELWFYYGGFDSPHDAPQGAPAAIGIGQLRLDGFCSMQAGTREGWVLSRLEPIASPEVVINAVTRGDGYVSVEILSADGRVVPGYSREECQPFTGDRVRHAVSWGANAPEFRPGVYKLRFWLRNADLHSYLPLGLTDW